MAAICANRTVLGRVGRTLSGKMAAACTLRSSGSRRTSFPNTKIDGVTSRRRAVSIGQTQTRKRVAGMPAYETVGVSVSSLWIRCQFRIAVFPTGVGSGGAIALTICRMSTTPAILPSSSMTARLSSPD
jgi:hypothetical protein